MLFIPGRAPYDLYSKDFKKGLALYSSNVLIMEKCEELLPDHFNFVRGVVDSQDLQLNISRETLQHNSQLRAIAKKIEKKITSELKKMRDNDREEYEKFFENFGRGLEFGIYNSYGMLKDQLADLLLFYSAKQEKLVTLDEYLEAAPADQKAIYYAAGESVERLAKMPIVKTVLGKGYDVLLCTKDVDEFCFQSMMTYGAPAAAGAVRAEERGVGRPRFGLRRGEEGSRRDDEGQRGPVRRYEGRAGRLGDEGGGVVAPDRCARLHHRGWSGVAGDGAHHGADARRRRGHQV